MAFTLDRVVPWGRSLEEYVGMFDLTEDDLKRRVLGCGDGPASFNVELNQRGYRALSVDPLYQFTAAQIESRIEATYAVVLEQLLQNTQDYVWNVIESPEDLGRIRMAVMQKFLADYEQGKREGRYLTASLPSLPFCKGQFGLTVCSHFLFLYTEQLSLDFHRNAIKEMRRVAEEVRIFPLLDLGAKESPYVPTIVQELEQAGHKVEIRQVAYEFQRGGNKMMRIWGQSQKSVREQPSLISVFR